MATAILWQAWRWHIAIFMILAPVLSLLLPLHVFGENRTPEIVITKVPPFGENGKIFGKVANVENAESHKVAVYIQDQDGLFSSRPFYDNPLTSIDNEGVWECDLPFGTDKEARLVSAYIFGPAFKPAVLKKASKFPLSISKNAITFVTLNRTISDKKGDTTSSILSFVQISIPILLSFILFFFIYLGMKVWNAKNRKNEDKVPIYEEGPYNTSSSEEIEKSRGEIRRTVLENMTTNKALFNELKQSSLYLHDIKNELLSMEIRARNLKNEFNKRIDVAKSTKSRSMLIAELNHLKEYHEKAVDDLMRNLDDAIKKFEVYKSKKKHSMDKMGFYDTDNDLHNETEDLKEKFKNEMKIKGVKPKTLPHTRISRENLSILLNELVRNAQAGSEKCGAKTVEIIGEKLSAGEIKIVVKDDGPGMDKGTIGRITSGEHVTTKKGGEGTGLQHCKKIVENCGGSLIIDSKTGDPSYTRIIISLPTYE